MIQDRVGLGALVAGAFLGDHVQKLRSFEAAQIQQGRHQRVQVVAINRPDIVESELLEQRARRHKTLGRLFHPMRELAHRRHGAEHLLAHLFGGGVQRPREQAGQVFRQRAHRRADRHLVVIEDDQQIDVALDARIVEGLEGQARAHRTIANHRDMTTTVRALVLALLARRDGHAQRRGDAGRRMRSTKVVVLALATPREPGQAVELAQAPHALAAAGEDLVRIALMTHVPNQTVIRQVEHVVDGHREFDRPQIGRQMPARAGHRSQQELAQLIGQLLELGTTQRTHLRRTVDPLQD